MTTALPYKLVTRPDGTAYCLSVDYSGHTVAWSICGYCGNYIGNCLCSSPTEPAWVTRPPLGSPAAIEMGLSEAGSGYESRTPVQSEYAQPGPRKNSGLAISDLVDQELVDRVKAAATREEDS